MSAAAPYEQAAAAADCYHNVPWQLLIPAAAVGPATAPHVTFVEQLLRVDLKQRRRRMQQQAGGCQTELGWHG